VVNEVTKKKSTQSTLVRDTAILFAITLIAGLLLGLVYEITAPIIAERRLQAKMDAYKVVYQSASEFIEDDVLTEKAGKAAETILVENGYDTITIDEALIAVDASGNKIGYVLSVSTQKGYKGNITLTLGYSLDGTITGMEFLMINETAGLGSKAKEPSFKGQFVNKQIEKFTLSKNATNADEVDALSGATITSRAVLDAVNAGICFITQSAEVE
jgi:electron transport complex protein RnfG